MDDDKRILVFSDAGGTGRSYHADLGARNQRQRIHYLLEPGWKADAAIQGLGRSNRTNQAQPPLFRPVATDVKGEKRFLSTIARRLDTLGAITRGQRQTGGQGLFRADDNLESPYATRRAAPVLSAAPRRQGRGLLARPSSRTRPASISPTRTARCARSCRRSRSSSIACWRCASICRTRCSPRSRSCSRRASKAAIAAGTYDVGVETLTAESFRVAERRTVYTHAATGAETALLPRAAQATATGRCRWPRRLRLPRHRGARLLVNEQSHRAAVQVPAASLMLDDGSVEPRTRLIRPMARETITLDDFARSHWREATEAQFAPLWEAECAARPGILRERASTSSPACCCRSGTGCRPRNMRVYRFETDDGERVIGRLVAPEALGPPLSGARRRRRPALSHAEAWSAVLDRGAVLDLAGGLQIRALAGAWARTASSSPASPKRHGRRSSRRSASSRRSSPGACGCSCRLPKIAARRSLPRSSSAIRCSRVRCPRARPDPRDAP